MKAEELKEDALKVIASAEPNVTIRYSHFFGKNLDGSDPLAFNGARLDAVKLDGWYCVGPDLLAKHPEIMRAINSAVLGGTKAASAEPDTAAKAPRGRKMELHHIAAPGDNAKLYIEGWNDCIDEFAATSHIAPDAADIQAEKPACRMQGGVCACRSGGSYGGCAIERGITHQSISPAIAPDDDERTTAAHWKAQYDAAKSSPQAAAKGAAGLTDELAALLKAAEETLEMHDAVTGGEDYGYISPRLRDAVAAMQADGAVGQAPKQEGGETK